MFTRTRSRSITASVALALAASTVVPVLAVAAVSPAGQPGSATACPLAFPVSELTPGMEFTGLTSAGRYFRGTGENKELVDSSVTPEGFTGRYLSRVEDEAGDLLIVELEGSRITGEDGSVDAGAWAGISGSPVYAADGRLIGSVAYGFNSYVGTRLAGVTPAADSYEILARHDATVSAPAETVRLEAKERAELRAAGVPAAAFAGGLKRLQIPRFFSVPGELTEAQAERITKATGAEVMRAGSGGRVVEREIPIVAGGNLALAQAYGFVSGFGVGTATAVCGDLVLGFGHPANWTEASGSIHGAEASVIVNDGPESYKMANLGAPLGTLLEDGQKGILGRVGVLPTTIPLTFTTEGPHFNRKTVTNVTDTSVTSLALATHALASGALAVDRGNSASIDMAWTIRFERADGRVEELKRAQRYSSTGAVFETMAYDLAGDVDLIELNEFEDVKILSVDVTQKVSDAVNTLAVRTLEVRQKGVWRLVTTDNLAVRAGAKLHVRAKVGSGERRGGAASYVPFTFNVPKNAAGASVSLAGNAASEDDMWSFVFDDHETENKTTSLDDVLKQLRATPSAASLTASVDYMTRRGEVVSRKQVKKTALPTSGYADVEVEIKPVAKKATKKKATKKKAVKKTVAKKKARVAIKRSAARS